MVQKISESALWIIVILAGTFSTVQSQLFLRRNVISIYKTKELKLYENKLTFFRTVK